MPTTSEILTRIGAGGLYALASAGVVIAQEAPSLEPLPDGAPQQIMATEFDLETFGYVTEEFTLAGTARAYALEGTPGQDGVWTTSAGESAPYVTRLFVHRPSDPAAFDGTVHVEWLNVTGGADNAVTWKFGHNEMLRSGTAYVGVSAQAGGVEAAMAEEPDRYADLDHPGDSFSYEIFVQAAEAIRANPDILLGGLAPERLVAAGESQSATRLTTYLNGVEMYHPDAFDGYVLLSGFSRPAVLGEDGADLPSPVQIRTDIGKPVLELETEMELQAHLDPPAALGRSGGADALAASRQPDSDTYRLWELPGATHVGAYFYTIGHRDDGGDAVVEDMARALVQPSTDKAGRGSCAVPINADPLHWVFNAALRHMNAWIAEGTPPPEAARVASLEVDGETVLARDAFGNAMGGIRTPYLDAPVATLGGIGYGEGFCFLNGTTIPFSPATFHVRYETPEAFPPAWQEATDSAIEAGFILGDDRARLLSLGRAIDEIPVEDWGPVSP